MSLNSFFERAAEAGQARPAVTPRQRVAQSASELSRAGDMQARLDVCIGAMVGLTKLLYEVDADNSLANVDAVTGRILIPVPWGSAGWRPWGLRKWEAQMLRSILIGRCRRQGIVLFGYDQDSRQWYLDLELFPDLDGALRWIQQHGPTLREWRATVDPYRERHAERLRAYRQ